MSAFHHSRRAVVDPRVVRIIPDADESAFLIGRGDSGQTGQNRADGPVILHRRHVVVDLEGGHVALSIEADLDVGEGGRRLRGPLEIIGPHPLHPNRLADGLGQITASSSAPALPPFDRP